MLARPPFRWRAGQSGEVCSLGITRRQPSGRTPIWGNCPTAALPAFAHVHCEAAAETVSSHVPDVAKTVEKKTHGRQIFELLVDALVTRLSRESG